jgi:hypothetical protein
MTIKISCGCNARISIPFDLSIKQRDEMALQFYEHHANCCEGKLVQSNALNDIAATLHDIFILIERAGDSGY